MGASCCEKHRSAQHDDSMTEPDTVMGWANMVLASLTNLAAELSPTPSEWPRWAWVCVALWVLTSCYFLLFAMAMYLQELKSYGGASRVSLPKMLAFSLTWMNGSLLSSVLVIPDLLLGRRERAARNVHYYGSLMGQFMFRILSKPPVVIGLENLPPDGEKGMVYVSNHQTSVDIALFYYIGAERRFSWVSKSTVFLIPGVGLLMKIARYVALTRGNRNSVKKMFDDCKERLAAGWSVMIFPQGTRRRLKVLDFKDGAFQLAIDSNSVVVRKWVVEKCCSLRLALLLLLSCVVVGGADTMNAQHALCTRYIYLLWRQGRVKRKTSVLLLANPKRVCIQLSVGVELYCCRIRYSCPLICSFPALFSSIVVSVHAAKDRAGLCTLS